MFFKALGALSLVIGFATAQTTVVGIAGDDAPTTFNQRDREEYRAARLGVSGRTPQMDKKVVVFTGDTVVPQFVDGASWKTTVTTINLENHPVTFKVLFFKDDGTDLYVPVIGQGVVRGMQITLATAASATFETTGISANLSQGWATLSGLPLGDTVGMMTVFRQSVPGRPDQEAVVPTVNQFDGHFVLLYDNTDFTTAIALANPTLQSVVIPVNIRSEAGTIIESKTIALGPYQHAAFAIAPQWPSTAGRRGAIEFQASGFGVGALGLRFSGSAFTSFHVLENFDWIK